MDAWFHSKYDGMNANHETIGQITMDDLSQMKYLERCVLESWRITPTVPFIARHLQEPLEIDKNSVLPAGTFVAISPWITHRNPDLYPNPANFDPDRFLPENVRERHAYAFLPFSLGPRNCIGWKVAIMEVKVILANIIRLFDITTTDKQGDVKLLFEATIKPERPYAIQFSKRDSAHS